MQVTGDDVIEFRKGAHLGKDRAKRTGVVHSPRVGHESGTHPLHADALIASCRHFLGAVAANQPPAIL